MLVHWHHSTAIMYEQTHKQNPIEKHIVVKSVLSLVLNICDIKSDKLLYIKKDEKFPIRQNSKILYNSSSEV